MTMKSFNRSIQQIVRNKDGASVDGSVMMSLQSLQSQINALQDLIKSQTEVITDPDYGLTSPNVIVSGNELLLTNKSGVAAENGEVVVIDTSNNESFINPTSIGQVGLIGVVSADSPDGVLPAIANNASGVVRVGGNIQMKCSDAGGAIVPGDLLITAASKIARKAITLCDDGIFAIALAALPTGTAYLEVYLFGAAQRTAVTKTTMTADAAGYVIMSENVGEYEGLVVTKITDNTSQQDYFPTVVGTALGGMTYATLSRSAGNHARIDNSLADWNTSANGLTIWWVPESKLNNATYVEFLGLLATFVIIWTYNVAGQLTGLTTDAKNIVGGMNEIDAAVDSNFILSIAFAAAL